MKKSNQGIFPQVMQQRQRKRFLHSWQVPPMDKSLCYPQDARSRNSERSLTAPILWVTRLFFWSGNRPDMRPERSLLPEPFGNGCRRLQTDSGSAAERRSTSVTSLYRYDRRNKVSLLLEAGYGRHPCALLRSLPGRFSLTKSDMENLTPDASAMLTKAAGFPLTALVPALTWC
jgi:hypothetical protein